MHIPEKPAETARTDANFHPDRQTLITGGLLITLALLAWAIVILQPAGISMGTMQPSSPDMAMSMPEDTAILSFAQATAFLIAWGVMMAAMMLPSATPMIALYGALARNFVRTGQRGIPVALFALIYLVLWLAFGIPVYLAGVLYSQAARSYPMLGDLLPYLVAAVLLLAGIYQFSPLKRTCLRVCRSPLGFLMGHWHNGYIGILRMGFAHAAYCIGCCWALMIVLVAAGAMSLPWVLLIAALVFAEKILPGGIWTTRVAGILLLLLGLLVALQPTFAGILSGQPPM